MDIASNTNRFRQGIRDAIKRKFADRVNEIKRGKGSLSDAAVQLGVKRQMLTQYADGSVPGADVLLTAFLMWDWVIKVEIPGETPGWFEFSLSDMEGGLVERKREPVQLSLFDALTDLDQNLDVLKKAVGRVEIEIERAFPKSA